MNGRVTEEREYSVFKVWHSAEGLWIHFEEGRYSFEEAMYLQWIIIGFSEVLENKMIELYSVALLVKYKAFSKASDSKVWNVR